MLWITMIILHALAGLVAFITGFALITSPKKVQHKKWVMQLYLACLIGLVIFMLGAMASHWYELALTEQIAFSLLVPLGFYMLFRAFRAQKMLGHDQKRYISDIGFTLIALFDGFVIVGAIDLGAPGWLVAATAILAVIIGSRLLNQLKNKFA